MFAFAGDNATHFRCIYTAPLPWNKIMQFVLCKLQSLFRGYFEIAYLENFEIKHCFNKSLNARGTRVTGMLEERTSYFEITGAFKHSE